MFVEQIINQATEGILILQSWIASFGAALSADRAGTVDHHDLGDVQDFLFIARQITVYRTPASLILPRLWSSLSNALKTYARAIPDDDLKSVLREPPRRLM